MKRVLFLSSWEIAKNNVIKVPFIHEQIGCLSSVVEATFIECSFLPVQRWIIKYLSGGWVNKSDSIIWSSQNYNVRHYRVSFPKLPTWIRKNPVWKDFYESGLWLAQPLARRIGKMDCIHAHVILPIGGLASALGEKWKVPFLLQEHSGPFEMHLLDESKAKGVQFVLDRCTVKFPVSKALQTRMQVHDKKTNYRIAPNLVRTDIFTPCESFKTDPDVQRQIRMISVCSAQRVKRHDIMFKTLKELIDRGWNAKLTLYGVDEFNLPLVHQREELGLSDKIEFLGRADKQTLHGAFCRHDVYLCTSELETFGLAPAEAISSGLIVVSSDCGGVNEFLNEDNGILVHQPDTKNFADAVEMVAGKTRTTVSAWQSIHSRYGEEAFKNYWSKLYTEILTTWDSSLN